MLRYLAALLVTVLLLASGRLLVCGWECMDEVAAQAEASCHTEPAPAVALSGEAAHACLPEVAEPQVTVAKTVKAQTLAAGPAAAFATSAPPTADLHDRRRARHLRFAPPHSPAPTVLRI